MTRFITVFADAKWRNWLNHADTTAALWLTTDLFKMQLLKSSRPWCISAKDVSKNTSQIITLSSGKTFFAFPPFWRWILLMCECRASVLLCGNLSSRCPVFSQDLVKSHLMYAVREEVEVLKEQIKELYERNSVLERENAVLKSLANSDQLSQLSGQLTQGSNTPPLLLQQQHPLVTNNNNNPLVHHEGSPSVPHQPNITSAWSPFPQNTSL